MTLSVSSLTSGWDEMMASSFSTASVSPDGGSLLTLWVYGGGWGVESVSGLDANWVFLAREGTQDCNVWAAVVPPGGSTGEVSVTTGMPSNMTQPDNAFCWDLDEITGARLWCSFVASNIQTAAGSSSPASLSFNSAAASDNLFMFGLTSRYIDSVGETPPWTLLSNVEQQYDSYLSTQVSPDVSDLTAAANLGSRGSTWSAVGIEVAAA